MRKLKVIWWKLKNGYWSIKFPTGKGRTVTVMPHPWCGFRAISHRGSCSCLDTWFMWFNISVDYGTCNFDELQRQWLDLPDGLDDLDDLGCEIEYEKES